MPLCSSRARACPGPRLARDAKGNAALEFALVSVPFVGIVLGLLILGYTFFLQEVVDFALASAARQVQLGAVPATYSAADFTAKVFCPALQSLAPCANLFVTLTPVRDYYSATVVAQPTGNDLAKQGAYCVGSPGQVMFARVVYLMPIFSDFWTYAPTVSANGVTGAALVSSAAFANENPSGATPPPANGC